MPIYVRVLPVNLPAGTALEAPGAGEEPDPLKAPIYLPVSQLERVQDDPVHGVVLRVRGAPYMIPGITSAAAFTAALAAIADNGQVFVRGENGTLVPDSPPLISK